MYHHISVAYVIYIQRNLSPREAKNLSSITKSVNVPKVNIGAQIPNSEFLITMRFFIMTTMLS